MSWNILPKNVLQYFLTKLKGLMYTKTEVDNLIPSITPNPSTTTGVLNGLEIDGTAYEIRGTGEPNVQADWDEVDSTADDYIKNKPTIPDQKKLLNYYSSRPTSGNVNFGDGALYKFCATSSMSTGKPTVGDANIIHLAWDNTGGWDGQIAVPTAQNKEMQFRHQVNGTWEAWRTLIDSSTIGSQSVNYANSAGSATKASILDGFGSGGAGNFTWGNQTGTGIWRNNDGGGGEFGFRKNNPNNGQVSMVIDGTVYVDEGRYAVIHAGNIGSQSVSYASNSGTVNGKTVGTNVPSNAVFTDTNDAVTQNDNNGNNWNLRLLLSGSQDDTTRTQGCNKTRNLQYNDYWKALYIGNVNRQWGMIYAQGNQQLNISASAEENYRLFLGVRESTWSLAPLYNQYLKLGTGSFKWGQIYSNSATINTSDRRKKKDIQPLDENARIFVMKLNPVSYKLKDGETGRTHYGMIAQDIEDELTELGMTAMDFAGFCKDEVYENVKTTREGFTEVKTVKKPGEYIYGLRYEEFIAPMIKTIQLQQQEIEELKHRIDILEGK